MAPLTGFLHATGDASKNGQGKSILKNRECSPIERVRRNLKDGLAWQQFSNVEAQQDYVGQLLRAYDAPTLQ